MCTGKGKLGIECFRAIMNDSRLDGIPLILETPEEEDNELSIQGYKREIALLRSLIEK